MKSSKFFLIIPAVAIITLFSIYFTANADTNASKSEKGVYTYSDSTLSNDDCCKQMNNCSGINKSSMQNHMGMDNGSMHNHMGMDNSNYNMDMNSGEQQHQHIDNNKDPKSDNNLGCMGH